MFSECEHDPPDNEDIILCAGPKERKALSSVLLYRTPICDCDDFISELHIALQKQTTSIDQINENFGLLLHEEDSDISFDRHLSDMCQEDVDKVTRHLHVLFIVRRFDATGVRGLDDQVTITRRKNIFNDIIIPWINWVRAAKQNKSDTVVPDKATDQSETDSSDTDKKLNTAKDNTNTTKKQSNNRKYIMFNKFQHDSPGCDDISLCAGPKEREALATILDQKTNISYAEVFVSDLYEALIDQADSVNLINEDLVSDIFGEEDGDVVFDQHLSEMDQENVDKVRRHFHALFIDRCADYTGVEELEHNLTDDERADIYNNIIEPWLEWVRSAKKNKSDTPKANTNKNSNTTTNKKTNNNTNNNSTNMNSTNNTTPATANIFESLTSTFSNMLGTLKPDMIRMTFDGKVAVNTNKGYKTYDVVRKKAVNMDTLVMPDMAAFLLLPSTKVKVGDIILRDGAFYSIISIDDATNELVGYNYESGKKETLVRETHCFLGNTYFYSKLVSPLLSFFGNKPKSDAKKEEGSADSEASEDTMSMLLPLAMMSQNGDTNNLLPLMLMSKMEGKEDSSMLKMLMLGGMMGGGNSNMNNLLPLMLMGGNFPAI